MSPPGFNNSCKKQKKVYKTKKERNAVEEDYATVTMRYLQYKERVYLLT